MAGAARIGAKSWRRTAPAIAEAGRAAPLRSWQNRTPLLADPERVLKLFQYLFFAFLIFVMVRISTGDADSDEARIMRKASVASGDQVKQVIYLVACVVLISLWGRLKGWRLPQCLSIFQLLLFAWIVASVGWAIDPAVSLRRVMLLLCVVSGLAICLDILGPERSLRTLYWVLAICILLSLAAVPFFKFAVHQPTEVDASIVGGWRGIFVHKNTAGAVTAAAMIIFIHQAIADRRWYGWALVALSFVFLLGTKSKTPAILLPAAIPMGFLYRYLYTRFAGRVFFNLFLISALCIAIFTAIAYASAIDAVFSDTNSFTGRAGLWQAVLGFVADHPWLGAGYSSLWGINGDPPILPDVTAPEQQFMVHSHGGYIELLATIGIPGLILALFAAVFFPLYQILTERDPERIPYNSIVFSIFVFCIAENFLETQLYTRDREIWVIYLVNILGLHLAYRNRLASAAKWRRRVAAAPREAAA